jgi:hypothetical protein
MIPRELVTVTSDSIAHRRKCQYRRTRLVTWNGKDVPPKSHELPACRDVVVPLAND